MAVAVKDTKEFVNKLYTVIEKNLDKNSPKLINHIQSFIDRNSSVLTDSSVSQRLMFREDDRMAVYDIIGVSNIDVMNVIKSCDFINENWKVLTNPFNLVMPLIIRYYEIKKKPKELRLALLFYSMYFYGILQTKYFPYIPNENAMRYTVNNLSNKYLLKKYKTVIRTLEAIATKMHETFQKRITIGSDIYIKDYVIALRSRISDSIKNVASEYYKNKESGNYLNLDKDNFEEEDYHMTDNVSMVIKNISDSASISAIAGGVNHKLAEASAKVCGVSVNVLRSALVNIIDQKNQEIRKLVTLILQVYLINGENDPRTINSSKFREFCLQLYIKSNTNDKDIIEIKKILDEWLIDCSPAYLKTERVATKNNFRKAVYLYFVFIIQQSYKG